MKYPYCFLPPPLLCPAPITLEVAFSSAVFQIRVSDQDPCSNSLFLAPQFWIRIYIRQFFDRIWIRIRILFLSF
jgi:hypothetical protein